MNVAPVHVIHGVPQRLLMAGEATDHLRRRAGRVFGRVLRPRPGRVSNALASIHGITITQAWANCDVTLEEFGFTATMGSGEPVRIAVGERDRIRSLSGDSLVLALKMEIEKQTKR